MSHPQISIVQLAQKLETSAKQNIQHASGIFASGKLNNDDINFISNHLQKAQQDLAQLVGVMKLGTMIYSDMATTEDLQAAEVA